jgi:hypothetical protein
MATHLIRVTPVDDIGLVTEHSMNPTYDTEASLLQQRAYLGVVVQLGQSTAEDGIIYSDGSVSVAIISAVDPGLKSQARLEWNWRGDFPDPPTGTSDVTLPPGWVPEKVGVVSADGTSKSSHQSWSCQAVART